MNKIYIRVILGLLSLVYVFNVQAQCNFPSGVTNYQSNAAVTTCTPVGPNGCTFYSEYTTFTGLTPGNTYSVTANNTTSTGGPFQLDVYTSTTVGTAPLAFASGAAYPITASFVATTATIYTKTFLPSCSTVGSICNNFTLQCTSCGPAPAATFQPTGTVSQGTVNTQIVRLDVGTCAGTNTLTSIDFSTTGSTNPTTDILNAKVYYTTTTTFATTTQFGTTVATPNGAFTVTGSQAITGTGYFWLTYDLACSATATNVLDAAVTSFTLNGTPTVPATTNPAGTRAITALFAPARTDGNSSTSIVAGSTNNKMVYGLVTGSATCPGNVNQVDFTVSGTAPAADILAARCYYTTTSTFSTATQYGATINNPAAGTISFFGGQAVGVGAANYFWLVYDISCTATATNTVNGDISSVTVFGVPYAATGTATVANAITALYAPTRTDGNSTTSIQAGTANNQMVYTLISGSSICPASVTQVNFTVSGTAPATDILAARCYYTTTSTFSTASQFGATISNPAAGGISFTGSQLLATGSNYFWLVYDISCTATATNTVNGDVNTITVAGSPISVTGSVTAANAITAVPASSRTDGNSTTSIQAGTLNNKMVYGLISGSVICPGTATQVDFTVSGTAPAADILSARCYYTTTSTFSTANQYGSAIANPAAGTISFTGSQLLATGNNYFWLVYDISCTATATNTVNGDINSITVGGSPVTFTGSATAANAITALYAPTRTDGNSSTSIQAGSANNLMVYGLISGSAACPGTVTQVNFTVSGTAPAVDIAGVRCYYTTTSTFSTANQYGAAIANPAAGTISFTGSQLLGAGAANYFWLVYDISCTATVTNTVNGDINSIVVSGNTIPVTGTAPVSNALTILYAPSKTDPNTTTAIPVGTPNAQMVYVTVSGSTVCPVNITQLNFTVSGTNTSVDIARAKCYYTTSSTFNLATPYGSPVLNPAAGNISFTGSQTLAAGSNYFWLVYDISCSGTATNTVNGDITSITIGATPYTITGSVPAANALSAATANFNTIGDGNFNDPTIWACGVVPPTNTTPVVINNNITISNVGNTAGDITISAGAKLTLSGGDLTLGASSAGAASGNSNKALTANGTLEVLSGTLNVNGGINITANGAFKMSGGVINIDPNDGTAATSYASTVLFFQTGALTVTGGNINIIDPPYTSAQKAIGYGTGALDAAFGIGNTVTLGGGDDQNAANTSGFYVECNINTGTLELGTLVVNSGRFAAQRHMSTNTSSSYITKARNIIVNAGSELVINSAPMAITGNLINNGFVTSAVTPGSLAMVGDAQYISGVVFFPSATAQSISGTGFFKKSTADIDPTAQTGNLIANFSLYHLATSPGVTLNMPLTITGTMQLFDGKVNTTSVNYLALGNGTSVPGNTTVLTPTAGTVQNFGSTSPTTSAGYAQGGWVNGIFKRYVLAAISSGNAGLLPIGSDTSRTAQVTFTVAPTVGGYLAAQWLDASGGTNGLPLNEPAVTPSTINNAAPGYWQIINESGIITGGTYTGTFTNTKASSVLNFANTTLLKRPDGSGLPWTLQGTHIVSAGPNSSVTLSRSGLTSFSEFAIGGNSPSVLPVAIEYFRGSKVAGANYLDWKVTTTDPSVRLILERSADGRNFKSIQDQTATAARCAQGFNYTDAAPLAGINYYRLKIISPDGAFKYSVIVALLNKEKGFELISVAPNPVKDNAILSLTSVKGGKMSIAVSDMTGKVVMTQTINVIAGNNPITMNFATLGAGTYNIKVINADNEVKAARFVKY